MDLFGLGALRTERAAVLETMRSLTDDEFGSGRTLCAQWAPRDVLAHLMGVGEVGRYVRGRLSVNAVNKAIVDDARALDRDELMQRARRWVETPAAVDRAGARFLLGDLVMHHQDVLRPLGRTRDLAPVAAGALFREGVLLSTGTSRNLLRHRVEPTTIGGRSLGRGRLVRGTTEVVALWLAGRRGLEAELEFTP